MKNPTLVVAVVCLLICGCQPQADDLSSTVASKPVAQSAPTTQGTPIALDTPGGSNTETAEPTELAPDAVKLATEGSLGGGDADVEFVRAVAGSNGWTFHVTVAHPDTGWKDYANGWDVVLPDGTLVVASQGDQFTRLLGHPHENEQPFTRSQSRLEIPDGVTVVRVRAHDIVHGFGGREVSVDLTQAKGDRYSVE